MRDSGLTDSLVLAEWAEQECRHLDLIASWETLVSVYSVLGFTGPDNDEMRLAEFKSVITELNKFLTRMKSGLKLTRDIDSAVTFLANNINTTDMAGVRNRASVAYNKLKQRWISQSIAVLLEAQKSMAEEGERDD